jgi:hypothetical protein
MVNDFSIFPFVKMVWRTKEIEQQWEPLRRRIYDCTAFAEYEMVRRGLRPCDVYDFGPGNILPRLKKPVVDGLFFLPMLVSKQYGGYGHRHYVTDKFTDDTFVYGVVAKKLEDAISFHDAGVVDIKQRIRPQDWYSRYPMQGVNHCMNPTGIDHDVTGYLLGYPADCRYFFDKTWLKDGCLDPMFEMAKNTEGYELISSSYDFPSNNNEIIPREHRIKVSGNPMLNRLARYWGFNIIPFFPHSFDCPKAADFADSFFMLMRERDREAADACLEVLSMPMRWSMLNAVTILEHPLFFGSANGYYRPGKVTVEWFPL